MSEPTYRKYGHVSRRTLWVLAALAVLIALGWFFS
jgi:hypothetical protein